MVSNATPKKNSQKFFPVRCGATRASGSTPKVEVGIYHNIPPTATLTTSRSLCAYFLSLIWKVSGLLSEEIVEAKHALRLVTPFIRPGNLVNVQAITLLAGQQARVVQLTPCMLNKVFVCTSAADDNC